MTGIYLASGKETITQRFWDTPLLDFNIHPANNSFQLWNRRLNLTRQIRTEKIQVPLETIGNEFSSCSKTVDDEAMAA
ncbi:hypothetical protein GRJ2_002005100 [Grus japonensis]|uniref:Uncharacterized protein n=1 Tax=Grus japonensis TaxID=30415 RepID=A0ABC9XCI1_GRUJA